MPTLECMLVRSIRCCETNYARLQIIFIPFFFIWCEKSSEEHLFAIFVLSESRKDREIWKRREFCESQLWYLYCLMLVCAILIFLCEIDKPFHHQEPSELCRYRLNLESISIHNDKWYEWLREVIQYFDVGNLCAVIEVFKQNVQTEYSLRFSSKCIRPIHRIIIFIQCPETLAIWWIQCRLITMHCCMITMHHFTHFCGKALKDSSFYRLPTSRKIIYRLHKNGICEMPNEHSVIRRCENVSNTMLDKECGERQRISLTGPKLITKDLMRYISDI